MNNKRLSNVRHKEIQEKKNKEENQKLIDDALKTKTDGEGGGEGKDTIAVTAILPRATYDALQKVVEYYRSPSMSHAIRLMIDDVAKGLEQGEVISRFKAT